MIPMILLDYAEVGRQLIFAITGFNFTQVVAAQGEGRRHRVRRGQVHGI